MIKPLKLAIYILPIPKGRPRYSRQTQRFYTPPRTDKYEKDLRERVLMALGSNTYPLYDKSIPLGVDIDFVMPRPARKRRKKDPKGFLWQYTGDDIDNLSKSVLDALQGVIWANDSQICCLRLRKLMCELDDLMPYIAISVYDPGEPPFFTCNVWSDDIDSFWDNLKKQEESNEK